MALSLSWRARRASNTGAVITGDGTRPGDAWLQFRIFPLDAARCRLRSTAFFQPRGLTGFLYWWVLYPVHVLIFRGMLKSIASRSEVLRSSP